jgi:hypothetical protein
MWGLWWTKRQWDRFSPSTSVSPANHSTNFSIIIIIRGRHNRHISGRSARWTQLDSIPHCTNLKKNYIPTNRVAQLYPQALGSIFVTSYDSQGHGGGIRISLHRGRTQSKSKLLYDWRFTANQFVLTSSPLRPTIRDFVQLNFCGNNPYVTSSLTRRWVCLL